MMRCVLGIDGGGTSTRAVILEETGAVLGMGFSGGSNYDDVGIEKALVSVQTAVQQARERAGIDRSGFVFNFDANGTLNGTYIIHASNPDGVRVDLNFAFSGNYQLRGIEATTHDYAVQTFTWDFVPNGFAELTARNGTITDMTSAFYDNSDLDIWSPAGSLHCENDVLSWMSVGNVHFVLERQS